MYEKREKQIALAKELYYKALESINPTKLISQKLSYEAGNLRVNSLNFPLDSYKKIYIIGAGKASGAMAKAIEEILGDRISGGMVIVKDGYSVPLSKISIYEASHPIPDSRGLKATKLMLNLINNFEEEDLVINLIGGGGSALLIAPPEGVTLGDIQILTSTLLSCGASIEEINTLRKHLSRVKGGLLAQKIYPATSLNLILSDVLGDKLSFIASGPTVEDPTTFKDCLEIIYKYNLIEKLPTSIISYIKKGVAGKVPETLKTPPPKTFNIIIGNLHTALERLVEILPQEGLAPLLLTGFLEGEVNEVAYVLASIIKEVKRYNLPLPPPCGIILGGEPTVTIKGKGKGGRNQHLALAMSILIDGMEDVVFLSGASDGTDGPTEVAGAIVDGNTVSEALKAGISAKTYLENYDSYNFFARAGGHLKPGPTFTNVNDIILILIFK